MNAAFKTSIKGVLVCALNASPGVCLSAAPTADYEYFVVGNPQDVSTPSSAGTLLMGGGTDVDSAFRWMIQKSGGGDVVVLRASGTDAYNPYIYELGKVDSVETLIIKTRAAASDPFVVAKIKNAEALFIAGGDQNDYLQFFKGTPVEEAIQALVARHVPVGGTSAGLAILGQFVFSAAHDTVDSAVALANPYEDRMTLEKDFLAMPYLDGVITDSHFGARDRMGRLLAFVARLKKDGWAADAKAIGVDERTALAVDADGQASLFGTGSAYLLRSAGTPEVCRAGTKLSYRNVEVYRLKNSATFDLASWAGSGGTAYTLSVEDGVIRSTQTGGNIY